jgi:hypothetical protein
MSNPSDRRLYRRVKANVLARPVGGLGQAHARRPDPRRVNDISMGGLRVYSDETYQMGQRLEMEILFTGGDSATLIAEVVWVENLPGDAPAKFDVGLRYVDVQPQDLDRILAVLGAAEPA